MEDRRETFRGNPEMGRRQGDKDIIAYRQLLKTVGDMTGELHDMHVEQKQEGKYTRTDRWLQFLPIVILAITGFYYAVKIESSVEHHKALIAENSKNIAELTRNINKMVHSQSALKSEHIKFDSQDTAMRQQAQDRYDNIMSTMNRLEGYWEDYHMRIREKQQ